MFLTPPTIKTLLLSLLIVILGIALPYIPILNVIGDFRVYVVAAGYAVLLAGNIIRGI
jgi:hypothetical protein